MAHEESVIHTGFHLQRPRPVLCCTLSMASRPVSCSTNVLATGHVQPVHCAEEPLGSSTSIPAIASLAWPCLYLNMQQGLPRTSFHFYCWNKKELFACFLSKSFNSWNDQKGESSPEVVPAPHTGHRLEVGLEFPIYKGMLLTMWDQQTAALNTTSCLYYLHISTAGSAHCSWQDHGTLGFFSRSCYPLKTQKAKSRTASNLWSVSLCWILYRGVKALP